MGDKKEFQIKCRAILLTYYLSHDVDILAELKAQLKDKKFTFAPEICPKTGEQHAHLYVHSATQMDHGISHWKVKDSTPNVSCNTTTGSNWQSQTDRGHFYIECKYKIDSHPCVTNYPVLLNYAPKACWCEALWKQGKILTSDMIECLYHYMCSTPYYRNMIQDQEKFELRREREEHNRIHKEMLNSKLKSFKAYPIVDNWKATFNSMEHRYKFLIAIGPSRMGKSWYIQSIFVNPFRHKGSIDWHGYDATLHDAVIFEDITGWGLYVLENKPLFQANTDKYRVGTSNCNQYAFTIDVIRKPMVFETNEELEHDDWIHANAVVQLFTEKTYVQDFPRLF